MITGLDWLQSLGAFWDFASRKLLINGEVYLLLNSQKRMFCRRLVLQESVSVPAQSEMDVPTMLIYPNYSSAKLDQEGQWMSEATDLGTGIHTCRTTAVSLPKGTQVAQLQPVEVIEGFVQRWRERAGQKCIDKLLDGSTMSPCLVKDAGNLKHCLMNSKIPCLPASMI